MKKLFPFLLGGHLVSATATAQTDVYNTGQLYFSSNTDTVYITGSLTNASTARLQNAAGNLYVLKDLTNDEAAMQPGGGTLWFTGTTQQTIAGAQPFRTYDWMVDNAAGVRLQNRLSIGNGSSGGNLSFINGQITSGTAAQDVFFYPNSTYSGYSNNHHIIGYCSKSGSTNFTFPIGNGALKADLDIFGLNFETVFQCKYFGTGYGSYLPLPPLVSIFDKEYWTLDRTSGTSTAQLTLKWNDARKPLAHEAPTDLRVAHFAGGTWVSEGGTGSGHTATGTVTSTMVNSFSPFTFGSIATVLPLKITDYAARAVNCTVAVRWTAHDETSVLKYIIEKSKDTRNWGVVSSIPISTAINTTTSHAYTDNGTANGLWNYRIKVVTKQGSVTYTNQETVVLHCQAENVVVYPTLARNQVYISIPETLTLDGIQVYDQNGKLVKKLDAINSRLLTLNVSGYAMGEYHIVVHSNNGIQQCNFIKTN